MGFICLETSKWRALPYHNSSTRAARQQPSGPRNSTTHKELPLCLSSSGQGAVKRESEEFRDKIATLDRYNSQSATLNAKPSERMLANEVTLMANVDKSQARTGSETATERFLDRHLGNAVHLFLSFLAILILAAAAIATVEIIFRDVPQLWRQGSEYDALHAIIQSVLLVAIAGELALLFLYHRTSAAIEVLIFVIARKMVTPSISGWELLAGVVALAGLVAIRFYFIPTNDKEKEHRFGSR